ncbi:MAG TPA: ABC transporter permease [Candidatus Acidoferrum sp.]|nr:ABC transporter permease [Candidatus Acidoferrum sp.]
MLNSLWQDVRYGLRMLGKNPGFTAIAVLTLALGISANTAIFSILDAVLLKPLPYPEPASLVAIWGTDAKTGETHRALSYPDFADLRDQNHTFDAMSVYNDATLTLTGSGEPSELHAEIVSSGLLSVLRVAPMIGAGFTAANDQPGSRVVLLSYPLWKSRFGSDAGIVGRKIVLGEVPYTVLGVMPRGFQFPLDGDPVDLWTTTAIEMISLDGGKPITSERGAHFLAAIGRLKVGVTLAQANADAGAISETLQKQYPDSNAHLAMKAQPAAQALVGDVRSTLLMLLGAVGCLLLIACVNVANLMLARAASREREIAVRGALGASGLRIARQLLTESVLLSLGGGLAGLLIAVWATRYFSSLSSLQIPRLAHTQVNLAALGFTALVAVATGVIFGLAPALHGSRLEMFSTLKEGGRTATGGTAQRRIRSILVVAEVSLALVLLVGASLLTQSLVHLWQESPGFDPQGVLVFDVDLPDVRYGKPDQSIQFFHRLLERMRTVPGVADASGVFPLPLSDSIIRTSFSIEGRPVAKSEEPRTQFRGIGLDYFHTMHIPLNAGRVFTERDTKDSTPVAIINETFAKKFFPGESAIGKRIRPGVSAGDKEPLREIVGVVGDVKHRNLWQTPDPECYAPYEQIPMGSMTLVARTAGNPMLLLSAMREQVKAIDPEVPIYQAKTLEDYVAASIAQRRFTGLVCGVFAMAGLLLAMVGLYGVMSYTVAQRTHEIGVRVAVGAERRDIRKLVLLQGARLTLAGILIGIVIALLLSGVVASQLFGVTPTDPRTYLAVAFVLMAVALTACLVPARRATRVDPMIVLRYE